MAIVSIINNKGGIAKTTTAIHLAAYLAAKKNKVLIIDFDPQRNLSIGFKIPEDYPYTSLSLLKGEEGFRVTQKAKNLFVLSGSLFLDTETQDIYILKNRLEQLRQISISNGQKYYDYIILDCPPEPLTKKYITVPGTKKKIHIPKLNEIATTASDYVMIPVNAEEYAMEGVKQFLKSVSVIRNEFNPSLNIAGVFFTMVMVNESNFKSYYQEVKESIPEQYFFKSYIRKDIKIEDSKKKGKSIFEYSPKSRAALDYNSLCKELLLKIKKIKNG